MATRSFTAEFKFNSKSASKLINAIETSNKSRRRINQRVSDVTASKEINRIIDDILKEE